MPIDKFGRHSRRSRKHDVSQDTPSVGFKIVNNNLDVGGRKLTNVGTPTEKRDAVTVAYFDDTFKSRSFTWQGDALKFLTNAILDKCRGKFLIRLFSRDAKLTSKEKHYTLAEGFVEYVFGKEVDGMEIQSIRTSPSETNIHINDQLFPTLKKTKISTGDRIKFSASANQQKLKINERTTLGVEIYLHYPLLR